MNHSLLTLFAVSAVVALQPASVHAESPLGGRLRERLAERRAGSPEKKGVAEMAYGKDPLQKLDYWRPKKPGSPLESRSRNSSPRYYWRPKKPGSPLVVFVHGGGWKRGDKSDSTGQKASHFLDQGYGFASINYRLVPANTVEDEAQDVASALAYLIQQSDTLGFDKTKVVLMGHSAGAHLSALVGTDMQYLKKAGLNPKSLCGVIPLDGACYDVPRQIAEGGDFMQDTYVQAFGNDRFRQAALSPTHHAAAPNSPAFLILHVQRVDGTKQSRALGEALIKAGTKAEVRGFEGVGLKGHAEINRRLGDPDYPATPVVDQWLKHRFS